MNIVTVILFLLGLGLIIKGGDVFVSACCNVAEATGMPKMLVGATIVSVATTMPEFFVSVIAVSEGATALGIGNALGSIICNTGLILAIGLMFKPSVGDKKEFYKKSILMLAALVMVTLFCMDMVLSAGEGMAIAALFFIYVYLNVKAVKSKNAAKTRLTAKDVCFLAAGAIAIIFGAQLLVDNGIAIAYGLGVSESVIGITAIALGTSLPELTTTIAAIIKKEHAIGVGNVIGANILNLTLILPTCAFISSGLHLNSEYLPMFGITAPRTLVLDLPTALFIFLLLIAPVIFSRGKAFRLQGFFILVAYMIFIGLIFMNM